MIPEKIKKRTLWRKTNREQSHTLFSFTPITKKDNVILSEMKKAGWSEIRLDPNDARKRLYKLKSAHRSFLLLPCL